MLAGLTLDELRARGAAVRHASGINTCARCGSHYLPNAPHVGDLGCRGHNKMADDATHTYPCCRGAIGSRGCTPIAHAPLFMSENGRVDPSRMIVYDPATLPLVPIAKEVHEVAPSSPVQASQPVTSASVVGASAVGAPPPVMPAAPSTMSLPLEQLGLPTQRYGDEIMVCGQLYRTGTPVILWSDVDGYDHYRVERRFVPFDEASWATTQKEDPVNMTTPNRYGLRKDGLTPEEIERVRGGQWDLPTLRKQMKQLVLHFDQEGLSRECFRVLQDVRDLSIHLMCDLDGTIYQALDLKERAWQATTSNTKSVGIEIANIGAYDPTGPTPLADWYATDANGNTIITIPPQFGPTGGIHTPNFVGSPARPDPISGIIQGQNLIQYDYTPQQYEALSRIIATFCTIFPGIPLAFPTDASGNVIPQKLPDPVLESYTGILGHYHIQTNKVDPGPAMNWPLLMNRAKAIMTQSMEAKQRAATPLQQQPCALVAPASAASAASATSSSTISTAVDHATVRKLERKILAQAEEVAARTQQPTDPFYIVDAAWWSTLQRWLHSTDASVPRPSAVTNGVLLGADGRTARRTGLRHGVHYRTVHRLVWLELVDLYGPAQPIIRPTIDIYVTNAAAATTMTSPAASDDDWIDVAPRQLRLNA